MNLRALANSVTQTVNPNTPVTIKASAGYDIGVGAKQVPRYADPVAGLAQVQALTWSDLQKVDGLNQEGRALAIYLRGNLYGVVRPDGKGGDLVLIPSGIYQGTWLIVHVLENWPDWSKAAMVYQGAL